MAHPKLWVHEVGGCDEYYRAARVEDVAGWLETHFTTLQVPAPQWRPVSEPPPHGQRVLVWSTWRPIVTRAYYRFDKGEWYEQGFDEPIDPPTHWMALPEPPK